MLDGSTKDRQDRIDDFQNNDEIRVFLLSTKAGGLGINLVAANIVVMHDLDINPNNDAQAQDRAWRMGQLKDVHVYQLCCSDTVETEHILKHRERKEHLKKQLV